MKTKAILGKSIVFLLLLSVLFSFATTAVSAAHTTLTTTVPENITIEIKITGNGSIKVNDIIYAENDSIKVRRKSNVSVELLPDNGCHVKSFIYNNTDITKDLSDNKLILPVIEEDSTFATTFEKNAQIPATEDFEFHYLIFSMVAMVASLLYIATHKKKTTNS